MTTTLQSKAEGHFLRKVRPSVVLSAGARLRPRPLPKNPCGLHWFPVVPKCSSTSHATSPKIAKGAYGKKLSGRRGSTNQKILWTSYIAVPFAKAAGFYVICNGPLALQNFIKAGQIPSRKMGRFTPSARSACCSSGRQSQTLTFGRGACDDIFLRIVFLDIRGLPDMKLCKERLTVHLGTNI